jgi:PKD repeat protein
MYRINIKNYKIGNLWMGSMFLLVSIFISSCDFGYELPDANSIADETPPSAAFDFKANDADYLTIDFTNLSGSATDYSWDFGDGNTSNGKDPSNTYAAEGSYTVTLTASDKLGATSTYTEAVGVVEPVNTFVPVILNPSFDIEGDDSYRDNWRNGDLGGVIQITSSPVHTPEKAAKLPSAGDRIGYQLITVLPDTDYTVSFYYTMKTSPAGSLTVAILGGHVTDPAAVAGATIASVDFNDQTDANTYVPGSVSFNTGDNTEVAIYFTNVDVESRIDSFEISEN